MLKPDVHGATAATQLPGVPVADRPVLPIAARQFAWTPEEKLVAHRNMHVLFPSDLVRAGAQPWPLPQGRPLASVNYEWQGRTHDLDAWFARTNATGLLVLKDGAIVLERYARGNTPGTLWASRSVAKSFTSTLVGMALHDGALRSLDDAVTDYLPELRGTLYERVSLRQNLQMTSGQPHETEFPSILPLHECTVRADEQGCLLRELKAFGAIGAGVLAPGRRFAYHSADVIVSGLVVQRATGSSLASYLERKLWRPFGMERAAAWNLEAPGGATFANSGLCACLRDWGRFGLFMLREGVLPDGSRQLPEGWIEEATRPSDASLQAGAPYGFNWWRPDPTSPARIPGGHSVYSARGSAGQTLMLNPAKGMVIAKWAVWDGPAGAPTGDIRRHEDDLLFAAIVAQLESANP